MNRAQRKAHARLWPVLLFLLVAVGIAALQVRRPVEPPQSPTPAALVP